MRHGRKKCDVCGKIRARKAWVDTPDSSINVCGRCVDEGYTVDFDTVPVVKKDVGAKAVKKIAVTVEFVGDAAAEFAGFLEDNHVKSDDKWVRERIATVFIENKFTLAADRLRKFLPPKPERDDRYVAFCGVVSLDEKEGFDAVDRMAHDLILDFHDLEVGVGYDYFKRLVAETAARYAAAVDGHKVKALRDAGPSEIRDPTKREFAVARTVVSHVVGGGVLGLPELVKKLEKILERPEKRGDGETC